MIVLDCLINFLLQIAFTVGLIFLFGFLIALCNKLFYVNFGAYGRAVCYITGAIGTPVHEGAHALFCLIFGHKITEIKLFQVNSEDGTLGYVSHSYNRKNLYQRIGNFFIGVAPIIVISALLYLFAYLLLPDFIGTLNTSFRYSYSQNFSMLFANLIGVIKSFFLCISSWQWWVFVIASMFFSLHMNLSKADIKGALSGVLFVIIIFLVVDIILAFVKTSLLHRFTQGVLKFAGYAMCIFMLSLIISIIALIISFVFHFGKRGINKKIKP